MISKIKTELTALNKSETEHQTLLLKNKGEAENLRKMLNEIEARKIRYELSLRKIKDIKDIDDRLIELDTNISRFLLEKGKLMKEAEYFIGLDDKYRKAKL